MREILKGAEFNSDFCPTEATFSARLIKVSYARGGGYPTVHTAMAALLQMPDEYFSKL